MKFDIEIYWKKIVAHQFQYHPNSRYFDREKREKNELMQNLFLETNNHSSCSQDSRWVVKLVISGNHKCIISHWNKRAYWLEEKYNNWETDPSSS